MIVLVGLPGAGKTFYFRRVLEALGFIRSDARAHESRTIQISEVNDALSDGRKVSSVLSTWCMVALVVNLLLIPSYLLGSDRCAMSLAPFELIDSECCLTTAADDTNIDPEARKAWISVAQAHRVAVDAVVLVSPPDLCAHNDTVRALGGLSVVSRSPISNVISCE